jgi:FKBP-type peptidyl-prolyl cis-trans isomerase
LIEGTDSTGVHDGYVFDTSGNFEPFTFTVGAGSVISGWEEAILQMKEGEKAVWIIPSTLGYSGTPQSGVPAYSTLVFHVTVHKVIKNSSDPVIIERQF